MQHCLKKREPKMKEKWHLDEQTLRVNGSPYILWRAVDSQGYELDVFLQKRRYKKAAIRFLSRLLKSYPQPKVIVTDKLKSYVKTIKQMCNTSLHLKHKGLNNRVENAHQPTRRKEKCLIRLKSPKGVQELLSLMGKVRNIFYVSVGRYTNPAFQQQQFIRAKEIWNDAAIKLLCA